MGFSQLRKVGTVLRFRNCLRNGCATVTKRWSGSHGCLIRQTGNSGSFGCVSEGLLMADGLFFF